MESIDIEGVKVMFPYNPYDIQLDYMKAVIKCLKQKTNGLLESPTGTGKTLCILCSTLGWIHSQDMISINQLCDKNESNSNSEGPSVSKSLNGWQFGGNNLPQVIYSSRTHTQLSQACKELKRTAYSTYKSVVIGSRDQLCINPDVSKLESISSKNQMCRHKIATNSCSYYRNYESKVERNEDYNSTQVFDIEDLVKLGRKNTCCPYYASRYIRSKASLVFTPYNYVLDPQIRSSNSLDLKNSIIIFDEGHNIEKMCEESVSSELRSETFAICIKHIDSVLQILKDINEGVFTDVDPKEYSELKIESVAKLKLMICDLEMTIDSMIKEKKTKKSLHETKTVFDIIDKIGLDVKSSTHWIDVMDKISMILTNGSSLNTTQTAVVSMAFTTLSQFIEKLSPMKLTTQKEFESYKMDFIKKFKIYSEMGSDIENEKKNFWTKKNDPDSWVLYIWCLSPSIGAKALLDLGVHSMIITSGTLAPINSFEIEMDLNFPIKLQNNHIIKEHQLSIINISYGRDGTILTSKYDNRDNLFYYLSLGQTLIELMRTVPKGALVFFSSYTALNKCVEIWKQNIQNIWSKLNSVKQIFLEPKNKQTFNDCIVKYKLKIDEYNSNGAVFFGVCRGKLSEGIDLPDDYCRCVVMTGLPFPSIADPRVMLKKQYLKEANTKLSPDGWYALQMKRALNQSIGRVVRHKNDYGVIVLLDSRFASLSDGLSKWVEKFIFRNQSNNLNQTIDKIEKFFVANSSIRSTENFISVKKKKLEKCISNEIISTQISTQLNSSNKCQKLLANDFTNEKIIFSEFKSNANNSIVPNSKSIFDTMSSAIISVKSKENSLKEMSPKKFESNESPLKRAKLDIPFNTITPKSETKFPAQEKLHSIIKTKLTSDSNSSKKVRWNEDNNRVHEFKSMALDFSEDNEMTCGDKNAVLSVPIIDVEEVDKSEPVVKKSSQSQSSEQMLEFWRKCGAELKELFKGSNKFNQLCQCIKTYKKYKNMRLLAMSFKGVFENSDEQKRNYFIKELSRIVPDSDYYPFLRLCDIKLTDEELANTKNFKIVKREVNLFAKKHIHFCMICKSEAVSPHRTLCCAFVACFQCFKKWRQILSSKCLNCNQTYKLSHLQHLYFESAIG